MKNKKKVILISCICAVVVIAMAAGAVVLMNRSGTESAGSNAGTCSDGDTGTDKGST